MRNLAQIAEYATGVVYIHAAPVALCPHVEWALSSTLECAQLKWSPQDAEPGMQRGPRPTGWDRRVPQPVHHGAARVAVAPVRGDRGSRRGSDGFLPKHVPGLLCTGSTAANGGDVILVRCRSALNGCPTRRSASWWFERFALRPSWDNEPENQRPGLEGW